MKSEELRIGNLFHLNGDDKKEIRIVKGVSTYLTDSVEYNTIDDDHIWQCEIEGVLTIPLTEEWLKRFGFKGNGLPLYFTNGFFEFAWKEHLYLVVEGQWLHIECEYVHQLQNIYFALTQTELKPIK